jgi:hypothetical protein
MTEIMQTLERIRADYVSDRDTFASETYPRPRYAELAQQNISAIDRVIHLLNSQGENHV